MKHRFVSWLGLLLLGAGLAAAEDKRPLLYPFDVSVGGQTAQIKEGNILFATVEKPVKPDAVVALEKESALFVINAFPCQEDGTVLNAGPPAAVVFKQNAKELKLSETIDKKKLKPGTYLMNVVAHNTTSRVLFTVSEKEGDVKLPNIKNIVEFLKRKAQ